MIFDIFLCFRVVFIKKKVGLRRNPLSNLH